MNLSKREDNEPDLYTQLCEAASDGDTKTVQQLLSWGVGPDKPQFYRTPALLCAVHHDQSKIIDLLLDAFANVNAADDLGYTPLMAACRYKRAQQAELVKLLLERGADVHAKTLFGDTALSYALEAENSECARLLIHAGAK